MKKRLYLFALALSVMCSFPALSADKIQKIDMKGSTKGPHKMPSVFPENRLHIEAYIDDSLHELLLCYFTDLSLLEVSVFDQYGDIIYENTVIAHMNESDTIPLDLIANNEYKLVITNGKIEYVGYFSIN